MKYKKAIKKFVNNLDMFELEDLSHISDVGRHFTILKHTEEELNSDNIPSELQALALRSDIDLYYRIPLDIIDFIDILVVQEDTVNADIYFKEEVLPDLRKEAAKALLRLREKRKDTLWPPQVLSEKI